MVKQGITIEQYKHLFSVIPQEHYERDVLLYKLLWNLGGRVSEILNLKRESLNKANVNGNIECSLTIRVLKRKNYEHDIPIDNNLAMAIEEYCKNRGISEGYLFSLTRQRINQICTRDGFNIGFPRLSPHRFRHGLAQHLMHRKGIDASVVSDRLGHSSVRITLSEYGNVSDRDRKSLVSKIEEE